MREKLAILIMITMFLVACTDASTSDSELTGDGPPIPIASVGGETLKVVRASYCWDTGCVDYAGPPDILEGVEPFPVSKGETITIMFDYEPEPTRFSVYRMSSEDEDEWVRDELVDGELKVPNEEGIYYYDFFAIWESEDGEYSLADSYYAMVIEVE